MFFLDSTLDNIGVVRKIKSSPVTIWAVSSLFLFIDTLNYSLTFASLPDILQNEMHTSKSANGVVTAMYGAGSILGTLIIMSFSDRYSARRPFQLLGAALYIVAGIVFFFAKRFYQVILFRLINGIASGVVCTLLYTTVGDVYPTNLLGFKVAIIHFCNTIAYTIGPICGERVSNTGGIPAIASIVITLGVLGFTVVFTVVEDSLVIRTLIQQDKEKPSGSLSSSDTDAVLLQTLDIIRTNEVPFAQPVNAHGVATVSEEIQPLEQPLAHTTTAGSDSVESPPKMTLWRLLLQIHVIVPTISTIVAIGIQCMLESVVPLHLDDTFKGPSKSGITFVIFGLALTVFVPMIGKINDVIIRRYGEKMRYYLMLFGAITSMLTITLMALAKSYGVMMFGYVLYAITNLCMWIPSKSAYGDFVNYLDSNSMATSFGISTIAWSVGAIAFPPIGTALYSSAGFSKTLIGMSLVTCLVCALACLVYPLRERRASRQL